LEKIHGSNFSLLCDGKDLICCRRTSILEDCETFFGFQEVRDKYKKAVFRVFEEVFALNNSIIHITIVGELFGGIYPHPEVQDRGYQFIQKGVYYCPWIEFMAFDIKITNKEGNEFYLNYDLAMVIFSKAEMPFLHPLLKGSLEDCLKFNIEINSTIPKILGLPPLEKNQMEGVVIKSTEPFIPSGKNSRAIFKHKNEKFAEVNPGAPLSLFEMRKNEKIQAQNVVYEQIERYINENRLNNLISKIGRITKDKVNEVAPLMCADVFKDFCVDNEELWGSIEEDMKEKIKGNTLTKIRVFMLNTLQE